MQKQITHQLLDSAIFQRAFIVVATLGYLIEVFVLLLPFFRVYEDGLRISSFSMMVMIGVLLPPLLTATAFTLLKFVRPLLLRVFTSVFLAIFAVAVVYLLRQAVSYAVQPNMFASVSNWGVMYECIVTVGAVAVFAWAVTQYLKERKQTVPVSVQAGFVGTVGAFVILTIAELVYRVVAQYPSNPNLSGFYPHMVFAMMPLFLFAVAYVTRLQQSKVLSKLFESSLLAVVGFIVFVALTQLYTYGFGRLYLFDSASFLRAELLIGIAVLVLYSTLLIKIKK